MGDPTMANRSFQTDGQTAGNEMSASVISEFHRRLSALENENVDLRKTLQNSQETGAVPYPGFIDHVSHVMRKHFFHDKPDGFDAKYDPSRDGSG